MDNILVTKDVAYAAKVGGGVIAGANELDQLVDGALAFIDENGTLITTATLGTGDFADSKIAQIAIGRSDLGKIFPVVRGNVSDINLVNYKASVLPVTTITFPTLATADTEGDVSVVVKDTSFASNYNIRTKSASSYKRAGQTQDSVTIDLVAKLNASNTWFTAARVNATTITITPVEAKTTLGINTNGLASFSTIAVTTALVYGSGAGADVLQIEKDFSVNEGNGNYTELSDLWYKQNMSADPSTNYDLLTLTFDGTHSTASTRKIVAQRRLIIATPNGAANGQSATIIMSYLGALFANAQGSTNLIESGADDGSATDNVE